LHKVPPVKIAFRLASFPATENSLIPGTPVKKRVIIASPIPLFDDLIEIDPKKELSHSGVPLAVGLHGQNLDRSERRDVAGSGLRASG
jgi:hypothetical protein